MSPPSASWFWFSSSVRRACSADRKSKRYKSMTDATLNRTAQTGSAAKSPSIIGVAFTEAALTAVIVFLMSFLMVGFQTQAVQGQYLGYVTRYSDVFWAVIIIPAGRFVMALDRQGK